ncbi:MAG: biotin/lipoyl-binding protein, partial [Caulobacterales bacterium]
MRSLRTLAMATVCLAACARPAPTPPVASAAPPADHFVVAESLIADVKPVDAQVASEHTTEARARIAGTLVRLLVTENDTVRKGQLIAVVADARIGIETSGFEAQAAAARAEAERANAALGRVRTLYPRGIYAKAALDAAEAAAKAADG